MAFYEDAEIANDKIRLKNWKDQLDNETAEANNYIDLILNNPYGDLSKHIGFINTVKSNLESLKVKYPSQTVEIDGYITAVNTVVDTVKLRWETEISDKLGN